MNTRLVEIFPRKNYTADATEIIDINLSDPISQLMVLIEPDANSTPDNAEGHPVRCLDKIELVDGSDVLYSLSGAEAQGVDFYHRWAECFNKLWWLTDNYMAAMVKLNFGRFLFDPEFAVDPVRFNNLQLKIKMDLDAGGINTNDMYLTVLGQVFDEKSIAAKGFLMHKELKTYTLAAASHEYTDLPIDAVYKQIFLRAQAYGYEPVDQIDTVKLTQDQDKKIPINGLTMTQLLQNLISEWPLYHERSIHSGSTDILNYFCTPTYLVNFAATGWAATNPAMTHTAYGGGGGRFSVSMSAMGPNHQYLCQGYAPHGVVPLIPDYSNDPADWFNPSGLKSLKLDVKGGASLGAGTAEIIAQQLRMY